MVMAVKAVCERFEDLQPVSEFLGYRPRKPLRTLANGRPDAPSA
jgi:hypothetical protein